MTPRIDLAVERTGVLTPARVRALARRVRKAARAMGCIPEEIDGIELRIVDDPRMQELKAAHLGVAEATDVLAFPAGDALPGEEAPGLGEVVLNRDAVARQAVRPGPDGWLDEATSLAIHGVAHLMGHDHHPRQAARRMLACERRGSRAVGLPCVRPYGGQ
ncbi:MAG: rRNA maturation RNase YbeY [Myxococcales bacterium]|nr:rRNA maturation RNase YbeY [Myxococcales bacterium]MCB9713620.1 rRNA maturation RNase YbeY [Myxococcales bacterium]